MIGAQRGLYTAYVCLMGCLSRLDDSLVRTGWMEHERARRRGAGGWCCYLMAICQACLRAASDFYMAFCLAMGHVIAYVLAGSSSAGLLGRMRSIVLIIIYVKFFIFFYIFAPAAWIGALLWSHLFAEAI